MSGWTCLSILPVNTSSASSVGRATGRCTSLQSGDYLSSSSELALGTCWKASAKHARRDRSYILVLLGKRKREYLIDWSSSY
jgi:hypothetical protein